MTVRIVNHREKMAIVREVCLAASGKPNVFSPDLIFELRRVLETAEREEQVAAIVLSHEGKVFCAGTDLTHLLSLKDDAEPLRAFLTSLVALLRAVERCGKPTIAALDGAAVGGGFELALACDLRVMSPVAWARLPEVSFGTVPGGGGVQSLTRLIGRARALDLVLMGPVLSAQECQSLGLARVAEQSSAREQALAIARKLAARSMHAMRLAKALILASEYDDRQTLDRMAVDAMVDTLMGPEGREGLRSISEKREPDFISVRGGADAGQ